MEQKIMVSINCLAYNHEDYVEEALESFLMQKTNFKFEILIHDDASTDKTAEIIREYQKKFPDIIKPIIQKENQHSQGVKRISHRFNHTRAQGKYIAMCEGDDYWTDEYKLQKQLDYMEQNPDCTFCFHNAFLVENNKKNRSRLVVPWIPENEHYFDDSNRKYLAGEMQLLGFIPMASFMFPKYVLDNIPDWFFEAPVGDNPMKLIASSFGYAYYINEPMCIYRFSVPNSATTKWKKNRPEQAIERCNKFIKMLDDFDKYSNFNYCKDIELSKLTWEINRLCLLGDKKGLKNEKFKKYLNLLKGPNKMKFYLLFYFPSGFNFIKKVRQILNGLMK